MTDKLKSLQNILKINFISIDLLSQSLVHKSYDYNNNNEKLEFLGDRVLGLVLSKKLLSLYPDINEGLIDKKFANLVNKKICAEIAKNIKIKDYMLLGKSYKGLKGSNDKIISDCLEALIGAIFLDKGLETSEKFILKLWDKYIEKSDVTKIDAKTKLQEYSLKKFKTLPKYKTSKQSGPQHSPVFKIDVQIPNSKMFSASGKSKKQAQQNAATKLLEELKIL